MKTRVLTFALVVLAIATPADAGVQNGTFDNGALFWEATGAWTFPATGGRPGAVALLEQAQSGSIKQTFTIDTKPGVQYVVAFDYRVVMFDGDPGDGHSAYPVMLAGMAGEMTEAVDAVEGDWQTYRLTTTVGEHTFVLSAVAVYGSMTLSVDNVKVETTVATDSPSWSRLKSLYD